MKHLHEEESLALAMGYGKPDATAHANACPDCQAAVEAWQQTLAAADAFRAPGAPEPELVWQQIGLQLQVPETRKAATLPGRAWALAAAVCLVALAVWIVRPRSAPEPPATAMAQPSPVLRFAVAQHLDRTQVLLVEIAHANELPGPGIDLSLEKASARDLLNANRLYHQSATLQGDAMMAHVLSALEPPLLEIAHSPRQLPPAAWRQMQQRIAASGVLFKVRVFDETLHAQHGAL